MKSDLALLPALDPRVTLCELSQMDGVLRGVADGSLEPALTRYAAVHELAFQVEFLRPRLNQVVWGRTSLLKTPVCDAETVSEVGFGKTLNVYDSRDGFVRVAAPYDGYLGWVPASALGSLPRGTYRFAALRGHVYVHPAVTAARRLELSYGAPLCVLDEAAGWSRVALGDGDGYVYTSLLELLEPAETRLEPAPETVAEFALQFLGTPYLWGGVSAWGLDCSGLVQTIFHAFGVTLPRDADQQSCYGREVAPDTVRAADLLFFPGHVAIALDSDRFVHANAHHMCVSVDSFSGDPYGQGLRQALTKAVRVV